MEKKKAEVSVDLDGLLEGLQRNDSLASFFAKDILTNPDNLALWLKAMILPKMTKKEFVGFLTGLILEKARAKDVKQAPRLEALDIADKILKIVRGWTPT